MLLCYYARCYYGNKVENLPSNNTSRCYCVYVFIAAMVTQKAELFQSNMPRSQSYNATAMYASLPNMSIN